MLIRICLIPSTKFKKDEGCGVLPQSFRVSHLDRFWMDDRKRKYGNEMLLNSSGLK